MVPSRSHGSKWRFSSGTSAMKIMSRATSHVAHRTMKGDVRTARRIPPGSVESVVSARRRHMLRGSVATRVLRSSREASRPAIVMQE
jgi:hypothetical protein